MLSQLVVADELEELLRIGSASEVLRRVQATSGVSIHIRAGEKLSVDDVEQALQRHFLNLLQKLFTLVPKPSRPFMEALLLRARNEMISQLIRAKASGRSTATFQAGYCAEVVGKGFIEAFTKTRDLRTAISLIDDENLRTALLSALKEYSVDGNPIRFDLALGHYSYEKLWHAAQELKAADRPSVKSLLLSEIDALNTLSLLRGKQLSLSINDLTEQLLETAHLKMRRYRAALEVGSVPEAILRLPFLKPLSSRAANLTLADVELWSKRRLAKINFDAFLHWPFHLGLIYAFVNLKLFELHDLSLIALGKASGMEPMTLRGGLVLTQMLR